MQDRNFDDLVHKFRTHIYGSPKGEIRLAVLQRDINATLEDSALRLNILDAGAGAGTFSSRFAQQGHTITLCDISSGMLDLAREEFKQSAPDAEVEFIHGRIQDLPGRVEGSYDMIFVHAVLEWLAEPRQALQGLLGLVKPGGLISVLFYNRNGLVMQNLLLGNLARIRKGELAGWGNSLTPTHPLDPLEVLGWFSGKEFSQLSYSGVRCFFDFMPPWVREKKPLDELIEMELSLSQTEPYRSLARYLHVIYRKN